MTTGSERLTRAMRALETIFLLGVEGVTEIWLVRHADCYSNMATVEDPPLSELGRDQALRLADRLRNVKPDAVFSSPLRRALETASAITDDVCVDDRLVEQALEISDDGALDFKESQDSAAQRMRGVVEAVVKNHRGQRVVLVTHAASIVACLTDVMRLDTGRLRILPYYTSISTIRALGDRRVVGAIGDVAHLE